MNPKEEEAVENLEQDAGSSLYTPLDYDLVLSTGSTLLDLAISGNRIRGGGIPGGVMIEIYGPKSSGKTALLVEICSSAQERGGEVFITDPEGRLDREYSALFGLNIPDEIYARPKVVSDLSKLIEDWKPEKTDCLNVFGVDSLAALSTDMEMEDGDKRGQRKAKELSELCRKLCLNMAEQNKVFIFTNQERQGEYGKTTPGGFAVPYHASLRFALTTAGQAPLERKKKFKTEYTYKSTGEVNKGAVDITMKVGSRSKCTIEKSSISLDGKVVVLYIVPGVGIDDIRANLTWLKAVYKLSKFPCIDKEYSRVLDAISYIEDQDYEGKLRNMVIDTWESIDQLFQHKRKQKRRF